MKPAETTAVRPRGALAARVGSPRASGRREGARLWARRTGRAVGRMLGAWLDALEGAPAPLPSHEIALEDVAAAVAASPRGNGFLALEAGVRHFAADGGLLGWTAHGATITVVGGVHGPDASGLLRRFVREASGRGWRRVLVFPVAQAELAAVRAAGFEALPVGSEAFVDPRSFDLRGKRRAHLRQMVNRARRRGIRVCAVAPRDAAALLADVYRAWLLARGGVPMRALVGTPGFERPLGRRYLAAFGPDGRPQAFVTLTPGWDGAGWGLDVMARRPGAPPGAMECLLVEAIAWARAQGARHFTLSAVPLVVPASVRAELPLHLRAAFAALYRSRLGNALYGFKGLHRFKAKFAPQWAPVWMAAWPRMGVRALFEGCRAWGLFGPTRGAEATGARARRPATAVPGGISPAVE